MAIERTPSASAVDEHVVAVVPRVSRVGHQPLACGVDPRAGESSQRKIDPTMDNTAGASDTIAVGNPGPCVERYGEHAASLASRPRGRFAVQGLCLERRCLKRLPVVWLMD